MSKYICNICNRAFQNKKALSGHQVTHSLIKCCSIFTKKEVTIINLERHNNSYFKNLTTCSECGQTHTNPKFCSNSCNASYVNRSRIHTEESKLKRVLSMKKNDIWPHRKIYYITCHTCTKFFIYQRPRKYCLNCSNKVKEYRAKASFSFTSKQYPHLFSDPQIKQYGWYRRKWPYPKAMVFDHLYRIIDGFNNNIPPEILSHPANAELVNMEENRRRQNRSSITINDLYERIKIFDKIYTSKS